MTTNAEEQELKDRLSLIETMIAEGRRSTESWGWTFVLWGVAYYVAIAWATWGHSALAWPVTMIAAGVLTGIFGSRSSGKNPETTIGRAMMAIWLAMGISTFLIMLSLGLSGRSELHVAVAIIGAMLGAANAASSIILKWKMQFACAVVWWIAGVAGAFTSDTLTGIVFLAAIFFCQIVFGIYGMIAEAREHRLHQRNQGASHA
jgi:fatty acid desaturase